MNLWGEETWVLTRKSNLSPKKMGGEGCLSAYHLVLFLMETAPLLHRLVLNNKNSNINAYMIRQTTQITVLFP